MALKAFRILLRGGRGKEREREKKKANQQVNSSF